MKKIINKTLIAGALMIALTGCNLTASNPNDSFTQLAEKIVDYRKSIDTYSANEGIDNHYLPDLSPAFLKAKNESFSALLAQLNALDSELMNADNKINLAIIKAQVQNTLDEYRFNAHYTPLTSEFGFHSSMSFLISRSDFSNKQGYDLYLKRLADIPRYFSENIFWMKNQKKSGKEEKKIELRKFWTLHIKF